MVQPDSWNQKYSFVNEPNSSKVHTGPELQMETRWNQFPKELYHCVLLLIQPR